MSASARRISFMILGGLTLVAAIIGYTDYSNPEEVQPGADLRHNALVSTAVTVLFFIGCAVVIRVFDLDAFSQGSIDLVAVMQLFVLWGWLDITGGREYWDHMSVTAFMVILVGTVLLFHFLQKERARS